jgi:hypothetical protein
MLESGHFMLTVVQVPPEVAATINLAVPPSRRAATPIKLTFDVPSIDSIRPVIIDLGGIVDESAWEFRGSQRCNFLDPEGNVGELRQAPSAPMTVPTDVLREIAGQLQIAYGASDLELFGSLLHPEVHWGAGSRACTNREEVLSWYRDLMERGARGRIADLEYLPEAILASVEFARDAGGGRPVPPEVTFQVLRVDDGLIVEITGYPSLAAAREGAVAE